MTDQSPERTFAIGGKTVEAVVVTWPDGHIERVTAPARNSKVMVSCSAANADNSPVRARRMGTFLI